MAGDNENFYPRFLDARIENARIRDTIIRASIVIPPFYEVVFLNDTATETLYLLGKVHSLGEVVSLLSKRYNEREDVIMRDVRAFINQGLKTGFITRKPTVSPLEKLEFTTDYSGHFYEDKLRFPVDVDIEVTRKCNMNCMHCYSSSSLYTRLTGPSLEDIDILSEELAEGHVLRVLIGGGEPLLRDDIVEIVKMFTKRGMYVLLSSNGYYFDYDIGRELFAAGLRVIQFSVDGVGDTHDNIRGVKGAFRRVVQAIDVARELGFHVMVKSIAMRSNIAELPALARLLCDKGVEAYYINRPVPAGRAKENWSKIHVYYKELEKTRRLIEAVWKNSGCRGKLGVENRKIMGASSNNGGSLGGICNAGITYVSLDALLHVKPCGFYPVSYSCGRLYREYDSLAEAWEECPIFKLLRRLSTRSLEEPCRSCGLCNGGCRAAALLMFGRLTAPDPLCPLVEEGLYGVGKHGGRG